MSAIKNKSQFLKKFVLFFAIGLICWLLSDLGCFNALERQSLDYWYRLKGEKTLNPKIEMILIDNKTLDQLGRPPYSADLLHVVLGGLDQLGARVVGVEIDNFENQVVAQKTDIKTSIVLGLSNSCTGALAEIPPDSICSEPNSPRPRVAWNLFPGMLDTARCWFAHLRIDPCKSPIANYCVPLLLKKNQVLLPAFACSILKRYLQFKESQSEPVSGNVRLNLNSLPALKLPVFRGATIPVNDFRSWNAAEYSSSFIDVLNSVRSLTPKERATGSLSKYWNKIVLIGNQIQNNGFQTPFASNLPAISLQATLLSNLLENEFLRPLDYRLNPAAFFVIFGVVFLIAVKISPDKQFWVLGIVVIFLFLVNMLCFFMLNIYFPVWGLFILMLISSVLLIFLKNKNLHTQPAEIGNQLPLPPAAENSATLFSDPFVRVVIFLGKGEKNINLTHTLETEQDCKSRLSAFHRSPQNRSPYIFSIGKLNRLSAETKRLGEIYYNYLQNNQKEMIKPIELIKRIGEKVYHEFGLSKTFREIFELQRSPLYLNLVIDDQTIPWQWAYDSLHNVFLCDRFPLSFSFAIEKADLKNFNIQPEPEMPRVNQKGAILLHGNWSGHPAKALRHVGHEIDTIQRYLMAQGHIQLASCTDPEDFLSKLDSFVHSGINLRIIHYSGHIEDDQLAIGDESYLGAGTLSQARNLYFYSRPVVFLNGCRSGQLGYLWDKYDDLATEFLACGAAACIITNFDIIETTARKFSETFYYYFLSEHLAVGDALRKTRVALAHGIKTENYDPDFDITRYFYNLYGDPTVRF